MSGEGQSTILMSRLTICVLTKMVAVIIGISTIYNRNVSVTDCEDGQNIWCVYYFAGSVWRGDRDDEETAVVVLSVPTDRDRGVCRGPTDRVEGRCPSSVPLLPAIRQGLLHLPTAYRSGTCNHDTQGSSLDLTHFLSGDMFVLRYNTPRTSLIALQNITR